MTVENNLATMADLYTQEVDNQDVTSMTKTGDYLPRIQVMGSNSNPVKEDKIPQGVFGIFYGTSQLRNLGKEFEMLSVAMRPKAMRVGGTPDGNPISFFDRNSLEFQQIVKEAANKDSGCIYGPDFLVWVPAENTFAELFCSNPTMRNAAPDLLKLMEKERTPEGRIKYGPAVALVRIKYIKNKKFSWHGGEFLPLSTPLKNPADADLWQKQLQIEVTKFRNPPTKQVEAVKAEGESAPGGESRER